MKPATAPKIPMPSDTEREGLPALLRPLVDMVARRHASVHIKLLTGFLVIAVLLLGMGLLSVAVLNRVDNQVERLNILNAQTDQAREMIYAVTAQSHFRAMALVTEDDQWIDKIAKAKFDFTADLNEIRTYSIPHRGEFFSKLAQTDAQFSASSDQVNALYRDGDLTRALDLHITSEHEISHELEDSLNLLINESAAAVAEETASFESNRRFLTFAVGAFSVASLASALLLGLVLSWSLIRPVRRVDKALALIADGDFDQRVEVPNRDEFGNLTTNLNRTTERLADLYHDLETLNAGLAETVEMKVNEIERVSRLRRYVSPQVAESILSGEEDVELTSSRKYLTTFFSDIRGFTEQSERMEPEEIVDELNDYLTEMTEIVFRHGGTLDKYVGDAIMVFFGDPVPQEDHAERAVRMALDMRGRIAELNESWSARYGEPLNVGMGVTTGWVTVGNVGSAVRTDYTVIGNQVNLASRLADEAEPGQILISERTMAAVESFVAGAEVDEVHLKGVSRPIKVYELMT